MRLLDTTTLEFVERDVARIAKEYAILSHRWISKGDVSFEVSYEEYAKGLEHSKLTKHSLQDMREHYVKNGQSGMVKIVDFCDKAKQDGYKLAWIDTCCIDKKSSAELSEAINAMYKWYAESGRCYVYLADVKGDNWKQSEWWDRGWTLQELIAPEALAFYNKHWKHIGDKANMTEEIAATANLPEDVLIDKGRDKLIYYPVRTILSWASHRTTSRVEDEAYCLIGLLEVNMPMLYGEGTSAFRRLQQITFEQTGDETILAYEGDPTEENASIFATSAKQFRPKYFPIEKSTSDTGYIGMMRPWRLRAPEFTCWGLKIVSDAIKIKVDWPEASRQNAGNRPTKRRKKIGGEAKRTRVAKDLEIHDKNLDAMAENHRLKGPQIFYIIKLACAWFEDGDGTQVLKAVSPCYMVVTRIERRARGCYDCVRQSYKNFLGLEAIEQELKQEYADFEDPPYIRKSVMEESTFYIGVHT